MSDFFTPIPDPVHVIVRRLLLFAGALLPFAGLSKAPEPVSKPPPLAKATTVAGYVKEPLPIALNFSGRIVEPLRILIRKAPKHGTLGEVQRTGRNSASVLYTPDPSFGPGDDIFTFATQSVDSPVSAQASVSIRLAARPAVLEHPQELDFGTVFLGDSAERTLTLRNSGGSPAAGELRLSPPWSAAGDGKFRVAANSVTKVRVSFAPEEARDFRETVPLGPDASLVLQGRAESPITWPNDGLVFSPKQREGGLADLVLTNQTASERTVEIDWPEAIASPRTVSIAANATATVEARIPGSAAFAWEGVVPIRSGPFKAELPVQVYPAPAKLTVVPPQKLELAKQASARAFRGQITVKNAGGSDAPIQILAPELQVIPDLAQRVLSPGEEVGLEVVLERGGGRPFSGKLEIRSPACAGIALQVTAAASASSSAARSQSIHPVASLLHLPPAASAVEPPDTHLPKPDLPSPRGHAQPDVTLHSVTQHEIELSWPVGSPDTTDYRIEWRRLSPGPDGGVRMDWIPWQGGHITIANGVATARLVRLPSNARWTIHIVPINASGQPGEALTPFHIGTLPPKKLQIPWWAWLLILATAGAGAKRIWQHFREAANAKDNLRIARLEGK